MSYQRGAVISPELALTRSREALQKELDGLARARLAAVAEMERIERRIQASRARQRRKRVRRGPATYAPTASALAYRDTHPADLSPTVHGGPEGLKAAAQEVAEWEARRLATKDAA
ncbi:hypothetical protein [Arthrobacter sp. efr-133-TYG-118]|uniref:hypothetical protein n=1 Tax=Arthrobacter sp. efr-133-TYG-118 TaxID=3040279 RepID=UPI00254F93D1|nr:hypothetical protein [Arthrobacter sp. efr-133-TYG-118]